MCYKIKIIHNIIFKVFKLGFDFTDFIFQAGIQKNILFSFRQQAIELE